MQGLLSRERAMRWAAMAAALVLFALATRTTADPDLWGHLRVGLDTLTARLPTLVDPYSFTQDRPWINHPWFGEVLMAVAYRAGGIAGLALLKGALVFAALWLVWSRLRGSDAAVRMIAVGVVVLGTAPVTRTLRPQLWSLLLLAIVCVALIDDRRWARRALPVLFAVWANLHGGWVVGLGLLGAWAAADTWSDRRKLLEWTAVVSASVAATACTPYGFSLWRFMLETVQPTRAIMDWLPLFSQPPMNWLPVLAAAGAVLVLLSRPQPRRLQVAAALAVLAYGAWRVSRIGPLFVISAAILLAPRIIRAWPDRATESRASSAPFATIPVVGAIGIVAFAAAAWIASSSLRCIAVEGTWEAPVRAARLLASARPGRLVTFFNWGEYAIWHLGPRLRVSMDGRRETVYSEARVAEHDAILAGDPSGLQALASWQAEYVWLPSGSVTTKEWLATHGYRIELDAPDEFVAVRGDLPALQAPISAPASHARCFPD